MPRFKQRDRTGIRAESEQGGPGGSEFVKKHRCFSMLCCAVLVAGTAGCGIQRLAWWRRSDSIPPRLARDEGVSAARSYRLRAGDPLSVTLRTPGQDQVDTTVDEYGMIRLPLMVEPLRAAGLTGTELERAIERAYVERDIYRNVTANVSIPARMYYLQGEVRSPGRYPVISGLTLRQAIASAGGYTDFARTRRIQITRGGEVFRINARQIERNPERDIEIKTGDIIFVPRRRL